MLNLITIIIEVFIIPNKLKQSTKHGSRKKNAAHLSGACWF